MLTEKDINQIEDYGLSLQEVYQQLETFNQGIPFVNIITTASVGNGIKQISSANQQQLELFYEQKKDSLDIVKFVPASGAATRMFQFLHEFLDTYNPETMLFRDYVKKNGSQELHKFFGATSEFAFVNLVRKKIREQFVDYKKSSRGLRHYYFAQAMLSDKGLRFGDMPKGLIPFHKYNKYATTAFEEQLHEGAFYAAVNDDVYLHFTFSERHLPVFKREFDTIKTRVSRNTKKTFHISYSFQKKETDTIAVTPNNEPYRDAKNKLVFRPSGHGALLMNLNEVDADIVFIKNIDNVAAQEYTVEIAEQKKMLAGKLLQIQKKMFGFLTDLEKDVTLEKVKEIQSFIWNELEVRELPGGVEAIKEFLNRPLRVCGVVENTGAPGGGPFWVRDRLGRSSLQIVEKSQIDMKDPHQASAINEATHFNPVDLVCGLRDYKGNKFDLTKYANPNSGFISSKSVNGNPIKALELPGLWNGAMANWNTVFIEVPKITFNPVKTVNDLLKKEHRPNA
ncbi:MAG: DUF4301 family protein [Flavobacteriaceae bacterium]|nr:DUF4301 family protein [Flavobacteriaceae bacterium]